MEKRRNLLGTTVSILYDTKKYCNANYDGVCVIIKLEVNKLPFVMQQSI